MTRLRGRDSPLENRYEEVKMSKGTVKWFNDAKGFGFITPETAARTSSPHHSEIQMDGFNR
jgi:CspA family cold shock protein